MVRILLLANTTPRAGEPGGLMFILIGFLMVLFTLGSLALVTTVIGKLFSRLAKNNTAPVVPAISEPALGSGDLSSRDIAVIAAAIYTLVKAPHRIQSIRAQTTSCLKEGRRSHFGSPQPK